MSIVRQYFGNLGPVESETFPQNLSYIPGLAHSVEMHCRYAMGEQVPALHYAPFRACPVCGFLVVSGCRHSFSEFQWDVKRK